MSPFYQAKFVRRFPVPHIAFERLGALAEGGVDSLMAIHDVLQSCCGLKSPQDADIAYFLERAEEVQKTVEETPEEPERTPERSFGSSFRAYINSLEVSHLLLWMCAFDYEKARQLYCEVDREDVVGMMKRFIQLQTEKQTAAYEAALYGFGGHYSSDASPEEGVVDMADAPQEVMAQLLGLNI